MGRGFGLIPNLMLFDEVGFFKHGTLSVGFIGLAECLKALIGKHHGESEEAKRAWHGDHYPHEKENGRGIRQNRT